MQVCLGRGTYLSLDAETVGAVVAAMRSQAGASAVVHAGCSALGKFMQDEEADVGRKIQAAEAVPTIVAALRLHPGSVPLTESVLRALNLIAQGPAELRQRVAAAGGIERAVGVMAAHAESEALSGLAVELLASLCGQPSGAGATASAAAQAEARALQAESAGAIEASVAAMRAHPQASALQDGGGGRLLAL